MFQKMGGASSQSVLLLRLHAARCHSQASQGNIVIGCNDAGSQIFGNKHETTKNVLQDFYSGYNIFRCDHM